jgi:UDP-N-acetylmuramyl pentapeptide phosphotransferase/UDP-N-acetylglucosamine-1-phosphate transferase
MKETWLFVGTWILGLLTCRLALWLATRLSLVDVPNARSSHEVPTPRGGGIGILLAFLPALLLTCPLTTALTLLIAAAVVALGGLGFLDDRRGASPALKAVVQLMVAGLVVYRLGAVTEVALPWIGPVSLGLAAAPLTVFWLVGFSNAFNFMDGIDGIAGLHAVLAAFFMAVAGWWMGESGLVLLALPLSAACLAFLSVNWPPAKVFMGDVGSLPVGFMLALLAMLGAAWRVPFVASFLFLGPFLYDTTVTIGRRILRRENLARAHRSHLYQRLVIVGFSHTRVTLLYGGWTLLTGILGLMYLSGGVVTRSVALGVALLSGLAMTIAVGRLEAKAAGDGRNN